MSVVKSAAVSPLVICAVAPFYAAWLYYHTTASIPLSAPAFAVVVRLASTWAMLYLPLAYLLIFTYGTVFLRVARARHWDSAYHYFIAGAAPSMLALATPFSWQEAWIPAALFGGFTGLAFWRLNRARIPAA